MCCSYEFGLVSGFRSKPLAVNPATSYTYTGLPLGNTSVYVCAIDDYNARVCEQKVVTVRSPPSDFKVTDALSSIDVNQMSGTGDVAVLAAGAQTLQSLVAFSSSGNSDEAKKVQSAVTAKTNAMINSLASSATGLIQDPQSMQQVCVGLRLDYWVQMPV